MDPQSPAEPRAKGARAFADFFAWQAGTRLVPWPVEVPFVDDTVLVISRGMHGATGAIYCGLHEFEDMAFALHCLRPGELFADVGSNVGTYTILASAAGASVVAFEPGEAARRNLERNIRANGLESRVQVIGAAVGEGVGFVEFTSGHDTENRIVAGQVDRAQSFERAPMTTLDEALKGREPVLVKMDVEGYEAKVVKGGERALTCPSILACIIEANSASHAYGSDPKSLFQAMTDLGYRAYSYSPEAKQLSQISAVNTRAYNTIFIRQLDAVKERLLSARQFRIGRHGSV